MLNEMDQTIVGGNKRITIPMGDAYTLRLVADLLRGFATTLDHWSRMAGTPEYTERNVMVLVSDEIDSLNRKLSSTARQAGIEIYNGNRKRPKTAERVDNEDGTVIIDAFSNAQHLGKRRQ